MITEIAGDIFKIRLPMPHRLDHINVYLVKGTNRLALVDTGLPTPDSWEGLTGSLEKLGFKFSDLTDILVTHSHPDHIGQLNKIRQAAPEAKLYMHRRELTLLKERADFPEEMEARMKAWLKSNGAEELALERQNSTHNFNPEIKKDDFRLEGGEELQLGEGPEGTWEVMWTPGHTAGHFVIHNRSRHIMLSGDHLLGQISSNVGKYPGSTPDPLGDYMASLNKISELELKQVLPAHGLPFGDYRARAATLLEHHRQRLEKMRAAVEKEPATAARVVKIIWGDRLEGFDRFLALVETLSHMERLVREKKVVPEMLNGLIYYRAA